MTGATGQPATVFGSASRACFEQVLDWLEGNDSAVLSHGELEDQLECRGRELLRRLLQDHLTLRATTEERLAVVADDRGSCTPGSSPATAGCWPACSAR